MNDIPPAPKPFPRGHHERFRWRTYGGPNGPAYEVYSVDLEHWAECMSPEHAEVVTTALEEFYGKGDHMPIHEDVIQLRSSLEQMTAECTRALKYARDLAFKLHSASMFTQTDLEKLNAMATIPAQGPT